MHQLFLKLTFYLTAGILLSSITWSTLAHSSVTGDYALSVVLLGMMFYVAGQFCVDRWRLEHGLQDFHPTKLWKIPYETTRGGIWLRVAFSTATNLTCYTLLASLLVLTTTARPTFMALLGTLFLLRISHLYWSLRGRYEQTDADEASVSEYPLRYAGGAKINRRARWLVPVSMAGMGAGIAAVAIVVG